MAIQTVALFGEAEQGEFQKGYLCHTLPQLIECFGNPPEESRGLHFAIQALLYGRPLLFFRVQEEGYSYEDYVTGLHLLETQELIANIVALCLPGVADTEILNMMTPFCLAHHSIIISSEADLYDYLVS
jgi:hypothetical protein